MRQLFLIPCHPTNELNVTLKKIYQCYADVVVLSPDSSIKNAKPLHHAKGLLGHTLKAIIFDARLGFPLDYFLCAANTIQKNGTFFLIWSPNEHDEQSTRFHTEEIPTQHFQDYLAKGLAEYSLPFSSQHNLTTTSTHHTDQILNAEQQAIIEALNDHPKGVITLFAARGTGKSFMTAEFLRSIGNQYVITAPNQTALKSYINLKLNFMAPDYLFLNHTKLQQEWLIVEEAAQMPIAHLEKLSQLADKVLLISSIHNYEGTGKGLEKKLADIISIQQSLTLREPHRFEQHDVLSQFCDYIGLNNSPNNLEKDIDSNSHEIKHAITQHSTNNQLSNHYDLSPNNFKFKQRIASPTSDQRCLDKLNLPSSLVMSIYDANSLCNFQQNSNLVASFYQFMNEYHYQTNAQDIRRLFDSPDQTFVTCLKGNHLIGGVWGIKEGLLSTELSKEVFNGYRRPKGNLVVQTLSAHSYYPELMTLQSLRISRIAVDSQHRQSGIAKKMIQQLVNHAKKNHYDFISTSFGLTEELLKFWQQCGFAWIHLGSHRDQTTGLHACIMLLPISEYMKNRVLHMKHKWQNDAYELLNAPFIHTSIHSLLANEANQGGLDSLDIAILQAHLAHKKPKESLFSALQRHKNKSD